jgi:hypothetical protein
MTGSYKNDNEASGFLKRGGFPEQQNNYHLLQDYGS